MKLMRRSLRRSAVVLLLAALALAAAWPARAQKVLSDAVLRGFLPTGDYVLLVNGKQDRGAEIYQNAKIPAYLILATALPSPVLLTPGQGNVETVNLMKVAKQKDGSVDPVRPDCGSTTRGVILLSSRYSVVVTTGGRRGAAGLVDHPVIFFQPSRAIVVTVSRFFATTSQFTILPPGAGDDMLSTI